MTTKNTDNPNSPSISDPVWLKPVKNNLTTPPANPKDGDRYRVKSVAIGAWAGKEDNVAIWDAEALSWDFQILTEAAIWYDFTSQNWHYFTNGHVLTQFDKIPLAESDVTGLVADLAGKAPLVHKANHVVGGSDPFVAGDNLDATAKNGVKVDAGALVGNRRTHKFISGTNISIAAVDNSAGESVDITITATGASAHALLDGATDNDTVAAAPISQDLIYANASNRWDRKPKGADNTFMKVVAGLLTWSNLQASDIPALAESGITGLVADLAATEKSANKGIANGYAPLGSDGLVAESFLSTGYWKLLATKVGVQAVTIDTGGFTAKKHLKVLIFVNGKNVSDATSLQFNGDTTVGNYGQSAWTDNAGGVSGSTAKIQIQGANFAGLEDYEINIHNEAAIKKMVHGTGGSDAANLFTAGGVWKNTTAQITSIQLTTLNGNQFLAGAVIIVLGHD